MRKLLLASVAMLSGTVGLANVAGAQSYPLVTVNGSTPVPGAGSPGAVGTAIPTFTTNPPLAPGSVTVRVDGRLLTYLGVVSDSARDPNYILGYSSYKNAEGKTIKASPGTAVTTKLSDYGVNEYARLFPSFDGVAANGLKYGAYLEIRADFKSAPGGGSGANGSSVVSISGTANPARGELYYRRETAYIGSDKFGFVRIGSTDQPTSLFVTGTFENFDDAGWNFQSTPGQIASNIVPSWVAPDQGQLYTTSKIVYLSPKFANLVDFGVSFEPNTGNTSPSAGSCNITGANAGSGCDALSSSANILDSQRRRNTVDGAVRLRTAAGPVGVAATAGGMVGGAVNYNNPLSPSTGPLYGKEPYNGLAVFDSGLQVTYGGLAVGGHLDYGEYNTGYTLQPKGGRDALGWLVGTSYAFGSVIVGASYFNTQSAGASSNFAAYGVGRSLSESGVAAGGTLTLAPGAYAFLSYLYGQRHEAGIDLLANGVSASAAGVAYNTHNNVQAQALMLGTQLRW